MSVTLYTVWRNYHNQWECVSIEAEEKPSTFVLPRCNQRAAFGYTTRMYKDDRRVCRSPQEAWECADPPSIALAICEAWQVVMKQ